MERDKLRKIQKTSENKSFMMADTESTEEHSEQLHWHTSIESFMYIREH